MTRIKQWEKLGITTIEQLKEAIKENKIKTTHHIDIGIKYYKDINQRIPREEINILKNIFRNVLKEISKDLIFEICGSYRRGCIDSGDIDILVSHPNFIENIENAKFLTRIIKNCKEKNIIIDSLTEKGETKYMGICKIKEIARRIDIRVVNYKSYYTSLLYFTGNKEFNIFIRNKAIEKNYSLNEYGLTDIRNNNIIFLNYEKEIFDILDLKYLTPEERNNF